MVPCNDPGAARPPTIGPRTWTFGCRRRRSLPKLTALARQWLANSGRRADRFGRARVLEVKLSQSDEFQYSLQGQPRDANMDPIEDFVQSTIPADIANISPRRWP